MHKMGHKCFCHRCNKLDIHLRNKVPSPRPGLRDRRAGRLLSGQQLQENVKISFARISACWCILGDNSVAHLTNMVCTVSTVCTVCGNSMKNVLRHRPEARQWLRLITQFPLLFYYFQNLHCSSSFDWYSLFIYLTEYLMIFCLSSSKNNWLEWEFFITLVLRTGLDQIFNTLPKC